MLKQQYLVSFVAISALVAIASGGSGYWLARQQGTNPLSDLLFWGFLFAFGLAVLLNLLALPVHTLRDSEQAATDFTSQVDAYLAARQAVTLPVANCYHTFDQNTLIYRMPSNTEPSEELFAQLCQLKLHYQCQRVEILSQQQWHRFHAVAPWQGDINFIGIDDFNVMKHKAF